MTENLIKTMLTLIALAAISCAKDEQGPSQEPLSGSFHGVQFEVADATAVERDTVLYVTLATKAADCETGIFPETGDAMVSLRIPREAQEPGTHELGPDPAPRVTVTTFEQNPDGTPHQTSITVQEGKLHIWSIGTEGLSASIELTTDNIVLTGMFTARLCAAI